MKPHNHTDYQKRFFKEVKKQFPFYGKREKEYLKQFQTEIDAYLEEFPDSSYEAMLEAIGTPKDVVENYFQNIEDRYQLSHMKKSNYIRIGIITIIGIFLIFTIYQGVLVYKSYLDSKDTLIIHESTEIFEDGSYIEEQIDCSPTVSLFSTTSTKYGHKTATYKSSSGNTIWTITVSGIFTYNGKSSKCTKSTVTTTCVNSNWKITNKSSKKVDSTATASATATKYTNKVAVQTIKRSVSLSCSKSGKLS